MRRGKGASEHPEIHWTAPQDKELSNPMAVEPSLRRALFKTFSPSLGLNLTDFHLDASSQHLLRTMCCPRYCWNIFFLIWSSSGLDTRNVYFSFLQSRRHSRESLQPEVFLSTLCYRHYRQICTRWETRHASSTPGINKSHLDLVENLQRWMQCLCPEVIQEQLDRHLQGFFAMWKMAAWFLMLLLFLLFCQEKVNFVLNISKKKKKNLHYHVLITSPKCYPIGLGATLDMSKLLFISVISALNTFL